MLISDSNKLVDVVFLSISGGTFIYVACSEIIVNEFARATHRGVKVLLVFLGMCVILGLWFMEGAHEHGEACPGEEGGHAGHKDH